MKVDAESLSRFIFLEAEHAYWLGQLIQSTAKGLCGSRAMKGRKISVSHFANHFGGGLKILEETKGGRSFYVLVPRDPTGLSILINMLLAIRGRPTVERSPLKRSAFVEPGRSYASALKDGLIFKTCTCRSVKSGEIIFIEAIEDGVEDRTFLG
ncbi:unnamed protein product [Linum trigynum]|uniref:Uncharacterized protein n=1 Tax=Linum trigynum TaxID=586398 RepID=A0AAV2DXB8_9ROSI